MNRRGFLGSIFAAGMAPAIVRAGSLMAVRQLPREVTGTMLMHEFFAEQARRAWNAAMEEAIVDRMRMTAELIAYGVLTTEDRIVTPNAKNPGDTIVYRRWLPYKDVVA